MIKYIWKTFIQNRLLLLGFLFLGMFSSALLRFYQIQIEDGTLYQQEFLSRITRNQTSRAGRGTIYDRNGIPLAYDGLTYQITIQDSGVYETRTERNEKLNHIISMVIGLIEEKGDIISVDFPITWTENGTFTYTEEGRDKQRFLADVFGHSSVEDLTYNERLGYDEGTASPEQVLDYLQGNTRYGIDREYSPDHALQITAVRYAMAQNSYQRYRPTVLAEEVSEETMVGILENTRELPGVEVVNTTVRRYIDNPYFSQLLGYTGPVSEEELIQFQEDGMEYDMDAQVGKSGIEQAFEQKLRGRNGTKQFYVDSVGRISRELEAREAERGEDVQLTIDAELQGAVYRLLEQKLAGILLTNMVPEKTDASEELAIDTADVLMALFDNHILDQEHFSLSDAGEAEKRMASAMEAKRKHISETLELVWKQPVQGLTEELQEIAGYIPEMLREQGYFQEGTDDGQSAWNQNWQSGTYSLEQYLLEGLREQWIKSVETEERYTDLDEAWGRMKDEIERLLEADEGYKRLLYSIMLRSGEIRGEDVCLALLEQGILEEADGEYGKLRNGSLSAYSFLREQIRTLKLTPAQLALDPCTASSVVADPDTGEVLALVTYPGYDNNRLANHVDGDYYDRLLNDSSLPLYNNATQQRTAPGSTFKPVTAVAALTEGLIAPETMIEDKGIFEEVIPSPRCWIYPGGTHGALNVSDALRDSCNYFFYSLGYGFSLPETAEFPLKDQKTEELLYQPEQGINVLQKYMEMFGFHEASGIEITENPPQMADEFPVTAAIGQSNHNYTTTQLARYASVLANHGTLHNLTLISSGDGEEEYQNEELNVVSDSTWDVIGEGMKKMADSNQILSSLSVSSAGKTGTAQQNRSRPNHALFIGYAPYEQPEIVIATRIAYGYSSSNAVDVSADIFRYYFGLEPEETLLTGTADISGNSGNRVTD